MNKGRWRTSLIVIVAFLALIAAWQVASLTYFNPRLVPPPTVVLATAWSMLTTGELWIHVADSLRRIGVGYAMGLVAGTLFGTAMARVKWVYNLFAVPYAAVRSIPPVALVPLAMLWFGIEEPSKYVITMYTTTLVMTLNTLDGLTRVPNVRLNAARCLGVSRRQLLWKVIVPSAMPRILTGARVSVGFAFMGVVAAELIASNTGIGYLITQSRYFIRTDRMFVGLFGLGTLALVADTVVRLAIRRGLHRFLSETERRNPVG